MMGILAGARAKESAVAKAPSTPQKQLKYFGGDRAAPPTGPASATASSAAADPVASTSAIASDTHCNRRFPPDSADVL